MSATEMHPEKAMPSGLGHLFLLLLVSLFCSVSFSEKQFSPSEHLVNKGSDYLQVLEATVHSETETGLPLSVLVSESLRGRLAGAATKVSIPEPVSYGQGCGSSSY